MDSLFRQTQRETYMKKCNFCGEKTESNKDFCLLCIYQGKNKKKEKPKEEMKQQDYKELYDNNNEIH
jgi:hypothetical protein